MDCRVARRPSATVPPEVRAGAGMQRWGMWGACIGLSLAISGCGMVDDGSYNTRDGVGTKLQWSKLPEETQLLEEYVSYICQQADLPTVYRADSVSECRPSGSEWPIFVQAGLNDIDRRCDGFLSYVDYLRRSRAHWLNQLTQTLTTTSQILGATHSSAKSMEIVTAAFGFASGTLTNATERLLTLAEHSTVQSVVLGEQQKLRQEIIVLGTRINNRPAAIHALRNYLRICMPMTIEQEINSTVVVYQQSGPGGLGQKARNPLLGVATTVPTIRSDRPPPIAPPVKVAMAGAAGDVETKSISVADGKAFQRMLCTPVTGAFDTDTRIALREFFEARFYPKQKSAGTADKITTLEDLQRVRHAAAIFPDCVSAKFANAFEVGLFSRPVDATGVGGQVDPMVRVSEFADALDKQGVPAPPALRGTTFGPEVMAALRSTIAGLRAKYGMTGKAEIDRQLYNRYIRNR